MKIESAPTGNPMPEPMTTRWCWALCAVLGVAFLARIWGIDYGLPFSYWNDEYHELMRAMQLGTGSFNLARTTKGGFYLVLFFEYGIYYVVLKLTGAVAGTMQFAEHFVRDPTMFYLIGRSTAAVLGCVTVAAVFGIGRQAYSLLAGMFAAVIFAVNVLHVDLSHRIGVDVPMVACAALALFFGMRIANGGGRRNYILAGLFAALATTTKLPGILVLLSLMIAHTYAIASTERTFRAWIASRELWIAFGVFAAVLLATNPGFLVYTGFGQIMRPSTVVEDVDDAGDLELGAAPNLWIYYLRVVADSMGWPLAAASVAAIGWALLRRNRADVMLLAYALANYLAISSTSSQTLYYPRYALPIILVLAVLVGRLMADCLGALPRRKAAWGLLGTAVLVAWPVRTVLVADHALTLTDTRTIAKEWFEAHVPAGAKVLVEGGKTGPKRESVQLRESRASLEERIAYWKKAEPRQAKFLEVKLATDDGAGYDLELVRLQSITSLADYAGDGVEYFVVRPEYFLMSRKASSNAARLLDDLRSDPRVTMIRRFAPESPDHPGVDVEIYRLAATAGMGTPDR